MEPEKPYCFIHVPKTGGTSVRMHLPNSTGHKPLSRVAESKLKGRFTFAFVRNPFERLVSAYEYLKGGGRTLKDKRLGNQIPDTFPKFVFNLKQYTGRSIHLKPMCYYLDKEVDFIGRYENIQNDFNHVCEAINYPITTMVHINETDYGDWREYYLMPQLVKIVESYYKDDLDRFEYKF